MKHFSSISELVGALPLMSGAHAPDTSEHEEWRAMVRAEVEEKFGGSEGAAADFAPFGKLAWPYHKMGVIDSLNLFDIEEIILFSWYWQNRKRYERVADLGANIGLHSLIMARCGWEVRAYEPDGVHVAQMKKNFELNGIESVEIHQTAVSSKKGRAEYIRVLGNTTGSHLVGAKPNPYGQLERIEVELEAIGEIMDWADLIKIDVEGHEDEVLLATTFEQWGATDVLTEIGSEENAEKVFEYLQKIGVRAYAQKSNWQQVNGVAQMPNSYKEGTLFISNQVEEMWPVQVEV